VDFGVRQNTSFGNSYPAVNESPLHRHKCVVFDRQAKDAKAEANLDERTPSIERFNRSLNEESMLEAQRRASMIVEPGTQSAGLSTTKSFQD